MTKTSRLFQGTLLVSAIALTLTACGQKPQLSGGSAAAPTATPVATAPAVSIQPTVTPQTTPETLKKQIKTYYSDTDEMKLIEKSVTVSYAKETDVYGAALKALEKSDDPKAVPLFEDVKWTSIAFDKAKGELKLDVAFGPKTQLGAPGEDLFLQALKKTLFQFPEVNAIYILKDGKQVDSLMGHLELPYPMKRPK
ncbi:GerMN domain-containing protein [Paenibacillus whitsoniae]|uniref:GerMN domain-containing protein n=1 Tax=Paenibacillus whitsoniae TaxID=2496558 RepID=A0A3S0AQZ1_9BACL|nr:GerMN domain-containing protein [Paenibacillus whitsoniae]RTE10385.1 hypothetical protein EJQ19_06865 [Paenibacillus whitsoniae]